MKLWLSYQGAFLNKNKFAFFVFQFVLSINIYEQAFNFFSNGLPCFARRLKLLIWATFLVNQQIKLEIAFSISVRDYFLRHKLFLTGQHTKTLSYNVTRCPPIGHTKLCIIRAKCTFADWVITTLCMCAWYTVFE